MISGVIPIIFELCYRTENKNNLGQIQVNILTKVNPVGDLAKEFLDLILG